MCSLKGGSADKFVLGKLIKHNESGLSCRISQPQDTTDWERACGIPLACSLRTKPGLPTSSQALGLQQSIKCCHELNLAMTASSDTISKNESWQGCIPRPWAGSLTVLPWFANKF